MLWAPCDQYTPPCNWWQDMSSLSPRKLQMKLTKQWQSELSCQAVLALQMASFFQQIVQQSPHARSYEGSLTLS